jgi:glycosyltransferase involved in cell wall biosynthesis
MNNSPISVVIPVYNGERFLAAALESVFAQTTLPAEVVVVDDGSTDASVAVARTFPGVTLLELPHRGVSAARNAAVSRASGGYLAFLDADDIWAATKLERQLELARQNPSAGIIMARQGYRFEGPVPPWFRGPTDGGSEPGFMPSAWFLPKETWHRVGPFDETMTHSEDTDWLARATDLGIRSAMVEEMLVIHRIHDQNASGKSAEVRDGVLVALRASLRRKHEGPQ